MKWEYTSLIMNGALEHNTNSKDDQGDYIWEHIDYPGEDGWELVAVLPAERRGGVTHQVNRYAAEPVGQGWWTYLIEHGKEIGLAASLGDELAKRVTDVYYIYFRCPEHAALAILECAVEDYRRATEEALK